MLGEALALLTALLWATAGVVMAVLLTRLDAITIIAVRLGLGCLFLLPLLVPLYLGGGLGTVSAAGVGLLAISGVLSLGIGDTLYVRSLAIIGVSRSHPISVCLFPLFTFVLAVTFLGEVITLPIGVGGSLIVTGIILVVLSGKARQNPAAPGRGVGWGVALVVVAAALWAVGFALLKVGAEGMNASLAGFLRILAGGLFLAVFLSLRRHRLEVTTWGWRVWAGLLWIGLMAATSAGVLVVLAVNYAGVAKVSVLVSTSPLFALPLSLLFLAERVTWRTGLGTALAIAGVWLVLS